LIDSLELQKSLT